MWEKQVIFKTLFSPWVARILHLHLSPCKNRDMYPLYPCKIYNHQISLTPLKIWVKKVMFNTMFSLWVARILHSHLCPWKHEYMYPLNPWKLSIKHPFSPENMSKTSYVHYNLFFVGNHNSPFTLISLKL